MKNNKKLPIGDNNLGGLSAWLPETCPYEKAAPNVKKILKSLGYQPKDDFWGAIRAATVSPTEIIINETAYKQLVKTLGKKDAKNSKKR